jgi:phage-related protein
MSEEPAPKIVVFVGPSLDNLKRFPVEARREIGHAIYAAQRGGKHPSAKPLSGDPAFRGSSVMEIVEPFDGNTYRAVYTVQFEEVLYVLDAFQKKSKRGIATPKFDIERIKERLKAARADFEANYKNKKAG